MYKYEAFIKDCVGKKKNKFTFIGFNRVAKKNSSIVMVDCQCECGRVVQYSASQCFGNLFPYQCIMCNRHKKKNHWYKEREIEAEFLQEMLIGDPVEDGAVLAAYDEKYKKYYRD